MGRGSRVLIVVLGGFDVRGSEATAPLGDRAGYPGRSAIDLDRLAYEPTGED